MLEITALNNYGMILKTEMTAKEQLRGTCFSYITAKTEKIYRWEHRRQQGCGADLEAYLYHELPEVKALQFFPLSTHIA